MNKKIIFSIFFLGFSFLIAITIITIAILLNTKNHDNSSNEDQKEKIVSNNTPSNETTNQNGKINIIFLHHSTGENIWNAELKELVEEKNSDIQMSEINFPTDEYGWENYPYDYWNIWVNNSGEEYYQGQPTLEILTKNYDVIMWKHCFPVGNIEEDYGSGDITSSQKTLANYKLQYEALKEKMHEFSDIKFIVWTAPALLESETEFDQAESTKQFVEWVINEWDEKDDNIFVWDFYSLETEGGIYLKAEYSSGDSHPNEQFSKIVAEKLEEFIMALPL